MYLKMIILLVAVFSSLSGMSQKMWQKSPLKADPPVCYASGLVEKSYVPPPREFLEQLKSAGSSADIVVNYIGFPDSVKNAFEYAISIWESLLSSPVPIYVEARWESLGSNTLASCGPSDYFVDFDETPVPGTYFPVALVEKLMEKQLTGPGNPDMISRFNSTIPWYTGTDGNTPVNKYDFVSTVLHEIAHGLGFTGFFYVDADASRGYLGFQDDSPAIFDTFVEDVQKRHLCDESVYGNPSYELFGALTSRQVFTGSPLAVKAYNNNRPPLYAPNPFNDGSSIYHLNSSSFPYGNPNSLMSHSAGAGEAIHSPGPITLGVLYEMGWKHLFYRFEPVKDLEVLDGPINFEVSIDSDFDFDSTSLKLVYSYDDFAQHRDSVFFLYDAARDSFAISFRPGFDEGALQYYLSLTDSDSRVFRWPADPSESFSIYIGKDEQKPVINHTPPSYLLSTIQNYKVEAKVTDNLAVDSVYLKYSVNSGPEQSLALEKSGKDFYESMIPVKGTELELGGVIAYQIVAVDRSTGRNQSVFPESGQIELRVEEIFSPVPGYFSDFNSTNLDFITGDFTITQRRGFQNPALFSPNPYPSPMVDDGFFNFSALLRYPIVVREQGILSFDEVVLVEPGETGAVYGDDEFWDYVIVEGSDDYGETWLPLADGYDSGDKSAWLTAYYRNIKDQNSITIGSPDLFINRSIVLTSSGNFSDGDTILIRFRLFSDPYASGWGWVIDNLRIQQTVGNRMVNTLSPGHVSLWPNPFSTSINWKYTGLEHQPDLTFEIFDLTGRVVKSHSVQQVLIGQTDEIPVSDLPAGVFIATVRSGSQPILRTKIIKR